MRQNHAAARGRGILEPRELRHQIGVGQAVKAVALHASRFVAARYRQHRRDAGHGAMECRVEARDLGQGGTQPLHFLHELDLARKMFRVEGRDPLQFLEQTGRDPLRVRMVHAVHDAMPGGFGGRHQGVRPQPVHEEGDRRSLIAADRDPVSGGRAVSIIHGKRGARKAYPVHLAGEQRRRGIPGVVERETDARRTPVERENISHSGSLPHRS